FDTRCFDDAASITARETGDCANPILPDNITKCATTIARLCSNAMMGDPFATMAGAGDYPCKNDPTFRTERETFCAGKQAEDPPVLPTGDCLDVVTLACGENPFEPTLCYYEGNDYIRVRGEECIDDIEKNRDQRLACDYEERNAIDIFCETLDAAGKIANRCDELSTETRIACTADPFGENCGHIYNTPRRDKCLEAADGVSADTATEGDRCPALVAEYCEANLFDYNNYVHCTAQTYNDLRRDFANDCYGLDTPECSDVKSCLDPAKLFSGETFGDIACSNAALDGTRARYCSEGDNITTSECTDGTNKANNPCIENPFNGTCAAQLGGTGITEAQTNRTNYCFLGGNAIKEECRGARDSASCILNLFADACTANYSGKRQARVDYCLGDMPDAMVCDPAKVVICANDVDNTNDFDDVFAPLCNTGYTPERTAVATRCGGDTPPTDGSCDRITTCTTDPYADDNLCRDEAFNDLRATRITDAEGECGSINEPTVTCVRAELESNVCTTYPFAWICRQTTSTNFTTTAVTRQTACLADTQTAGITPDQCEVFLAQGNATHALWTDETGTGENRILDPDGMPLEFATDTSVEKILKNVGSSDTDGLVSSYNLSFTYENSAGHLIDLGNDVDSGFASYQTNEGASAGILNTTNLGTIFARPDDGSGTTATWYGRAAVHTGKVAEGVTLDRYASNDFKLTIDFNLQTLTSRTSLFKLNDERKILELLNAKFNEFGIIYGQVEFDGRLSTLSGLIGA
ncbi:MAG: hypothetical protein K8953_04680, partial [Proteobacteria bacterium]|nr:hypothetical protein [Pseudomonadota bacterium]